MSGSGGNAFLDFLRALAPSSLPVWAVVLTAALASAAAGLVLVRCIEWFARRSSAVEAPRETSWIAIVAASGALAVVPIAPHVFFADVELGALLVLALLAATTARDFRSFAWWIPLACALLVPVAAAGTLNWTRASRLQAEWLGLGWFALRNPFGLPALVVFFLAARGALRREHVLATFLVSALAAVFFLGGFESPLTYLLRRSLGEDPGFVNHVTLADGTTETRIAIGGLVFLLVAASTLIVKTALCMFVLMRGDAWAKGRFLERAAAWPAVRLASIALLFVLGAGLWEWGRSAG